MKLASYSHQGKAGFGVLDRSGSGIIALDSRLPGIADLGQLIAAERVADVVPFLDDQADVALADVTHEMVLRRPGKIFCIGVNYRGRAAEYADKGDAAYPSVFVRFADSFTGHGQPLLRPPESPQLDYEGEIVAVIGKAGRRIPVAQARNHIFGLTLGNEGTIRDWVRHAKFNVTQGKNWDSTGALGPHIVTLDEIGPFDDLHLRTHVNGELRQDDHPRTMKYSIEYQIHYLSTFNTLQPGDIVFTGTPIGAGARFDPPRWLVPGDVVEVSVPEIGTLRNPVADEFPAGSDHVAPEPQ